MLSSVPNSQWFIASVSAPVLFNRGTEETWYLLPVRRYVLNARHVDKIGCIDTLSELPGSAHYRPLQAGRPLTGKRIFVERFRDRGLGDLLFLTGPFAFMHHVTGGEIRIHVYAFSDRGQALHNSPYLEHGTVYVGPTHYDDFQHYDYQWLVNSVTESNEEADQLNVYDALFAQLGLPPEQIEPRFKRPHIQISEPEIKDLHALFHSLWSERKFDLRRGYYVLAPLTHSALRSAPYTLWLELAQELTKRGRPILFIGKTDVPLPDLDICAGEFLAKVEELAQHPNIVSLFSDAKHPVPLRLVMALISNASGLIGLDSGPLYIAQGCRVPAISLWGPHDPGVRIGYDPEYMDLAVWNQEFCAQSPCFAYSRFPVRKCPLHENQKICHCLSTVTTEDVLKKVDRLEALRLNNLNLFKVKSHANRTPTPANSTA